MAKSTNQPVHKVEISQRNIVFTILLLVGIYLLFLIRDVITGLFISILFATALNPLVNRIEKLKIPRAMAIFAVYILIITILGFLTSAVIPPLIVQTSKLMQSIPIDSISEKFQPIEVNLESLQIITNQLGSVTPLLRVVSSTFSSIVTVVTFAVITFYLLLERRNLHKYLIVLFGDSNAESKAESFVDKLEHQIGGWVRGEVLLMFIVGLITYFGLRLLNIPFALPLAIIAGFLELIPNIGPTISALPAIVVPVIAGQNPIMALFVAALYVLVQQLENNIIVPKVMQSVAGVHPLVTIIVIVIGLKLTGVTGAILAVPFYLIAKVTFFEVIQPYLKRS